MSVLAFALFTFGTLSFAANTALAQRMFVDDRDFPGGPSMYRNAFYSTRVNVVNNAMFFFGGFISDGLLVRRLLLFLRTRRLGLMLAC
jgi:hypothetical protein